MSWQMFPAHFCPVGCAGVGEYGEHIPMHEEVQCVRVCAHMHMSVRVWMCAYACVCLYARVCACMDVCMYVCACMCPYACACVCACMDVYRCMCVHLCAGVCMYACVRAHVHVPAALAPASPGRVLPCELHPILDLEI